MISAVLFSFFGNSNIFQIRQSLLFSVTLNTFQKICKLVFCLLVILGIVFRIICQIKSHILRSKICMNYPDAVIFSANLIKLFLTFSRRLRFSSSDSCFSVHRVHMRFHIISAHIIFLSVLTSHFQHPFIFIWSIR